MKELSIFVDESGDMGEYDYHSPYYIITLIMHNQVNDISDDLKDRQKIIMRLMSFARHINIQYRSIVIEKNILKIQWID